MKKIVDEASEYKLIAYNKKKNRMDNDKEIKEEIWLSNEEKYIRTKVIKERKKIIY